MCSALAIHQDTCRYETTSEDQYSIKIYDRDDQERSLVEKFISDIYLQRFGAHIHSFAPKLIALTHEESIVAAMGIRDAKQERLFLEQYLDIPIDTAIHDIGFESTSRDQIVEVGQLAAAQAGQGRQLMRLVVPILADLGFQWVASTVTRELRQLLIRLGVVPLTLGNASPNRLGSQVHEWGSYYEHSPVVVAGRILPALETIARNAKKERGDHD